MTATRSKWYGIGGCDTNKGVYSLGGRDWKLVEANDNYPGVTKITTHLYLDRCSNKETVRVRYQIAGREYTKLNDVIRAMIYL